MRLGVLDQSPVKAGMSPADAVAETVALARHCEALGYARYWLAEHHNTAGLAGSAPEILIAHIAAATRTMRIGSGGVMLSHYSPYKVAEQFRMLETLHPGRIDLGLGRAPGGDGLAMMALADGAARGIDEYPRQIADLIGHLGGSLPNDHPYARVTAMPTGPSMPEIWLLGSSEPSALYAAHFGLAFAHAHFINPIGGAAIAAAYRERFRPTPGQPQPRVAVAAFALVAATEDEAQYLAASRDLWRLRLDQGILAPVPTPEEALAYPYSEVEALRVARNRRRQFVGTADQVKARLDGLVAEFQADELIVVSICHDPAARRRSYQLLAGAFELGSGATCADAPASV